MTNLSAVRSAITLSFGAITVLTILADRAPELKAFLASMTGHHWITKSVLVIVFFVAAYPVFARRSNDPNPERDAVFLIGGSILCFLLLFAHFVVAYANH